MNRNEATCREFISAFMHSAIEHVKKEENQLQLRVEEWLDGPRGYGPLDYCVDVGGTVVLVHEAKKEDFEKGAAQNIVQMHSAVEVGYLLHLQALRTTANEHVGFFQTLRTKRKIPSDNSDDDTVPVLVYGIVTNALQWVFFRWGGSLSEPTVEVSTLHPCELNKQINEEVEAQASAIMGHLISILQSQVRGLKNPANRHRIKRHRS